MNGGILGMNGRGVKNTKQPVVNEKDAEELTSISNTPQLTRLGKDTVKMFEYQKTLIDALQKNSFKLMSTLLKYQDIDCVVNKGQELSSNTQRNRQTIFMQAETIEEMFIETGGKIWQELADRLRQDKTKDSS